MCMSVRKCVDTRCRRPNGLFCTNSKRSCLQKVDIDTPEYIAHLNMSTIHKQKRRKNRSTPEFVFKRFLFSTRVRYFFVVLQYKWKILIDLDGPLFKQKALRTQYLARILQSVIPVFPLCVYSTSFDHIAVTVDLYMFTVIISKTDVVSLPWYHLNLTVPKSLWGKSKFQRRISILRFELLRLTYMWYLTNRKAGNIVR